MSNDGLIIENMDLSHIHLAVRPNSVPVPVSNPNLNSSIFSALAHKITVKNF